MFWDILRVINIGIAAVVLALLVIHGTRRWRRDYTRKERLGWLVFLWTTIVLGESAVENLLQDNPGGLRVILTTQVLLLVLAATLAPLGHTRLENLLDE